MKFMTHKFSTLAFEMRKIRLTNTKISHTLIVFNRTEMFINILDMNH